MRLWHDNRKQFRHAACQRKGLREEGRPLRLLVSVRRHRACDGLDLVYPAVGRHQAVEDQVANAKPLWRALLQRSRSLLAGQSDIVAGTLVRQGEECGRGRVGERAHGRQSGPASICHIDLSVLSTLTVLIG